MRLKIVKNVEKSFMMVMGGSALLSIFTTLGIIFVLGEETFHFFRQVPIFDFLFGATWEPMLEPKSFGVLPLVTGTLLITVGSAIIAIPLGTLSAIYLSEYANNKTKSILRPILEVLAGIPTIVYGYFALTFITPILKSVLPQTEVFNALSGIIVVGIMILPMVSSLCYDAFQGVPKHLKYGGYAMGATSFEVIGQIVIPAALSRILASFILAMSRAIGETMAVTLAAGSNPVLTINPLHSIQTMTSYIVQVALGDTPAGTIEYLTSYAVAALLFLITLSMNLIGQSVLFKYRSEKLT